jgi:hypothetical protein
MNWYVLAKHTIPGDWMSEEEQSLEWNQRLMTQINRRYFELGNDTIWITAGIVNGFVLVGVLSPFAIYLTLSFFALDVILESIRAFIELDRLNDLKNAYTNMRKDELGREYIVDESYIIELNGYIDQLDKKIEYDTMRLGLNIFNAVSILIAACCALPIFMSCPIIPLVGALWLVAVCFITYALRQELENSKPKDHIEEEPGLDPQKGLEDTVKIQEPINSGFCGLSFFSPKRPSSDQDASVHDDMLFASNGA